MKSATKGRKTLAITHVDKVRWHGWTQNPVRQKSSKNARLYRFLLRAKQFKGRFDSYADSYRAQAERILGGHSLSTDEELQIRPDLQLLGAEEFDIFSEVQ